MRLSHQFPPAHHTAVNLEQFAKEVAQETDGTVEVQIFGAAQLFKPAQHHAAVAFCCWCRATLVPLLM